MTATLPGRSAAEPWPDELRPNLVDAIADVLRTLHGLPTGNCPFDRSLAVTMPAAAHAAATCTVDLDNLDPGRMGWSASQLLEELHRTRPVDEGSVVGHGDPCLANLIFAEDGSLSGVIDVGRLGVADRYNDLAIATRSIAGKWHPRYGGRLMSRYGIGAEQADDAKIGFYRLLDEFF